MENKNKIARQYGWKDWDAVISDYRMGIITHNIFIALEDKASIMKFNIFLN